MRHVTILVLVMSDTYTVLLESKMVVLGIRGGVPCDGRSITQECGLRTRIDHGSLSVTRKGAHNTGLFTPKEMRACRGTIDV